MTSTQSSPERTEASAPVRETARPTPTLTEAFLSAFRHHPAGVAIITADAGDGPVALTVSSLISVSASPPMVAFSLSAASSTAKAIGEAKTVVVHLVRRADMELARLCATSGTERFGRGVRWDRLESGEPYYPQIDRWFRAEVRDRLAVPGASLVVCELTLTSPLLQETREDDALVYANRTWHELRAISDANKAPLLLWPEDSATF